MLPVVGLLALALPQGLAPDSVRTLPFAAFYEQVARFHPEARQAQLRFDAADEGVRAASGDVYDPSVEVAWSKKAYKATPYYNYVDAALKIPTPIGVEVKLGYERTAGDFTSPERTPDIGLFTAGLIVPLGQGLLTDQRRNALAVARAARAGAAADRRAQVNKLLLTAAKGYAEWYEAWRRQRLQREAVQLARDRLEFVRQRVVNGDQPAIDSVEADLEVQRRETSRLEADAQYRAASEVLAFYLWTETGEPATLAPGVVPTAAGLEPDARDTLAVDGWLARAMQQHPDLQKALARLRAAEAERGFRGQELLPDAFVALSAIGGREEDGAPPLLSDVSENFKLDLVAKTPLLLLKDRGRYNAAGDRLEIAQLDTRLVRREIEVRVRVAAISLLQLARTLEVQRRAVAQAQRLRDGEQLRFENGEGTLFLVNLRERTLVDERLKLAALEAKAAATRAELAVALGEPGTLPAGIAAAE